MTLEHPMNRPSPLRWDGEDAPRTALWGPINAELEEPHLLGLPDPVSRDDLRKLLPADGSVPESARFLLEAFADALSDAAAGRPGTIFSLSALEPAALAALDDILGEGEVSILIAGSTEYQITETVFAGLWRVRTLDMAGALIGDHAEVGQIPQVVRAAAVELTSAELVIGPEPADAMNVMPVLAEIKDAMARHVPGRPNHVISFTLLPMNEADLTFLGEMIGGGKIRSMSKGYGTARVTSTRARGVWQVEFLNAMGTVIVDTIEIGDIPAAILAEVEDFEDSAERVREVLGTVAS